MVGLPDATATSENTTSCRLVRVDGALKRKRPVRDLAGIARQFENKRRVRDLSGRDILNGAPHSVGSSGFSRKEMEEK